LENEISPIPFFSKKNHFFLEKRKYLCPANKKNSMLATSSSLLVDILNKFVCKYHQKTVAQEPTSKLCGFEQFGTGGWRARNNI
jgi:hypothetical protein